MKEIYNTRGIYRIQFWILHISSTEKVDGKKFYIPSIFIIFDS